MVRAALGAIVSGRGGVRTAEVMVSCGSGNHLGYAKDSRKLRRCDAKSITDCTFENNASCRSSSSRMGGIEMGALIGLDLR